MILWVKGLKNYKPSKFVPSSNQTQAVRRAAILYFNLQKCSPEPKMSFLNANFEDLYFDISWPKLTHKISMKSPNKYLFGEEFFRACHGF